MQAQTCMPKSQVAQAWNLDEIMRDWDIYVAEPINRLQKLKHFFWIRFGCPGILIPRCRSKRLSKIKYLRPGLLYTLRPKEHNVSMTFTKVLGKTTKEVIKK